MTVSITGDQGSNRLATLADANCLVVIDENAADVAVGDQVDVLLLSGDAGHPLGVADAVGDGAIPGTSPSRT